MKQSPVLSLILVYGLQFLAGFVESSGKRLLGVGFVASEYNDKLNKFVCPGVGYYPARDNCTQFFHCFFPGHKPTSIYECKGFNTKFHHLSRKCEPSKYVDCKSVCRNKAGIVFPDLTSKFHFIRCARGGIAERYKCKVGEFKSDTGDCHFSKNGLDVLEDAIPDPPSRMIAFMKQWHQAQKVQLLEFKMEAMKEAKSKKKQIPKVQQQSRQGIGR